ncbi:MBL fold metallo-hydrolase [Lutimonas sp.]|uniref:MBL fold metallo-hydrolase n=1 Tax=Lutimonas sp. TaxID=1872403 RepID=UPI003D9AC1F8
MNRLLHKSILSIFTVLFTVFVYSQRPEADTFETSNGELTVQPVLHGTLVLTYNDKVIYIDPYGGANAFSGIAAPDLIMITDIHGDHLNEGTLDAVKAEGVTIIAPQAVADKISEKYKAQIKIVGNDESMKLFDIHIKALPMYNLPESADAKHTKGRGNGYVLEMGKKKVYISGDTAGIDEMRNLQNIDIAFVCMNLPYTMDVNEAASAVLDFKPAIVYPYHYRGKPDMSDTEVFRSLVNKNDQDIEVRLRNWYPDYN